MKKAVLFLLILSLVCAALLTACSGGASKTETTDKAESAASESAEEAPASAAPFQMMNFTPTRIPLDTLNPGGSSAAEEAPAEEVPAEEEAPAE